MSSNQTETVPTHPLLEEFPPHTYAMWKEAALDLLKGAPFEKRLITPTYEGFALQPIYHASDVADLPHLRDTVPGSGSQVRGRRAGGYGAQSWLISQELSKPTPSDLNRIILHELEKGQNELNLWMDAPTRAGLDPDAAEADGVGLCGVSASTSADFATLLAEVQLPAISVYLRAGAAPEAIAALFLAAAEAGGTERKELRGCVEADPLAYLVEHGRLPTSLPNALDGLAALTRFAAAEAPQLQTIAVQGHPYHNGGASSVEEMAAALATGVYYLKAMLARGLTAEAVAPHLRIALSVGSQYFVEIAKFRAMRLLWNRVLEAFEVPAAQRSVHLHARTGLWNKTARDPWVNSLRTTTEGFAAVVAGVDSLHLGAFDEVVREADDFSRRLARNTHHILAEECDLTRVIDPAGGSWAVESLTDQMARQAWSAFQQIERDGGILAVLQAGSLQETVAQTLAAKRENLTSRRDVLVGTNQYPNPREKPLDPRGSDYAKLATERTAVMKALRAERDGDAVKAALKSAHAAAPDTAERIAGLVAAAAAGATLAELCTAVRGEAEPESVKSITLQRGAAPYEALADRVGAIGERATLLQLNYGPSRRYRLRADWTTGFFSVAGFPVAAEHDFLSIEDAVEAVKQSSARAAIIVSDDETYREILPALVTALKQARPKLYLVLAGAPGDEEAEWRRAGLDDFVHVRVNNYRFNEALARRVGA